MKKIIAINCSPRSAWNTATLIREAAKGTQTQGAVLEIIDLYKLEYHGRGYGKGLLKQLAKIAVERGCGRLEWWCLDWYQPSIDFYLSLGAEPMKDWTVYRITGKTLTELAQ